MRERNARGLLHLAAAMILLLAVSAPAEAGRWDWLKKLLGGGHVYVPDLVQEMPGSDTQPEPAAPEMPASVPASLLIVPGWPEPEPGELMLFDLRAVKASPLPGAPANCWSPIALDPATVAVLSAAGHAGGREQAGIWVYSRTGEANEVIPAAALPAGSTFFAIAGPDPSTPGSLIVVLKATQPTLRALFQLADLRTGGLKDIPDAPPIDGDPSQSREVRDLMFGSRIRDGKWVGVITRDGGRRFVIESLAVGGVRVEGSLELDPRDGRQCSNPNWLSDTEILYVAKPWQQPAPVALPVAPVLPAVPAPPAQP